MGVRIEVGRNVGFRDDVEERTYQGGNGAMYVGVLSVHFFVLEVGVRYGGPPNPTEASRTKKFLKGMTLGQMNKQRINSE